MPKVKCEFCGYEQDTEVSRICDNCGRRLGRTRTDLEPAHTEEAESDEPMRCPNCGVQTRSSVCSDCGAHVRKRGI